MKGVSDQKVTQKCEFNALRMKVELATVPLEIIISRISSFVCFKAYINELVYVCVCMCQCNEMVGDLFMDLRNGHNLITLLEILTQERLVSQHWLLSSSVSVMCQVCYCYRSACTVIMPSQKSIGKCKIRPPYEIITPKISL